MTAQAMRDAPTTEQPFDTMNEVGCANERIQAALKLLSENIREIAEDRSIDRSHIYDQWLLLELIRRSFDESNDLFHRAENALYRAGVPRQFAALAGEIQGDTSTDQVGKE